MSIKILRKYLFALLGSSLFFNVVPISVVQSIFKFANIFFTVRSFVGRIYVWFLGLKNKSDFNLIY